MREPSRPPAAPRQSWSRQLPVRGRGVAAVAAGVLVAVLGTALPSQAAGIHDAPTTGTSAVPEGSSSPRSATGTYIVRATPGYLDALVSLLHAAGYPLTRRIGIIDAAVAQLPAGAADQLRQSPVVASVTADAAV